MEKRTDYSEKDELWLVERLRRESPDLHNRFRSSLTVIFNMSDHYQRLFPHFSDHSILHALNVTRYVDLLACHAENQMSVADCYILLMAVYLHDIGMCVNSQQLEEYRDQIDMSDYRRGLLLDDTADLVRTYHHELSACVINKFWSLFEIPDEEYAAYIAQVAKGHRKTDLADRVKYPNEARMKDGELVHPCWLAALLRLGDECDMAADRNPEIIYDSSYYCESADNPIGSMFFETIASIRYVSIKPDLIEVMTDPLEGNRLEQVKTMVEELRSKMDYCKSVLQDTPFSIIQKQIVINSFIDERPGNMTQNSLNSALIDR